MDEEQEGKQNGQTIADKAIDTVNDTANAIKDGSNLAKDIATGNVLGGVKDSVNLLRNKTVRKVLLIMLLIPMTIVVALLFPVFTIYDGVGNKLREIGDRAVDYFTVDNEGVIEITETEEMDIINDTIKAIEDLGVTLDDLHLMGDVDYSDPEIEEKAKEALKKYIRKFYEAQAVTQTLYTNPNWFTEIIINHGKTYGKVFVYRTKGEDIVDETNSEPLRYKAYEEMQKLQQEGKINEIKKYYSANNGKLIVPEWTVTTVNGVASTEISLREVDYKSVISQYTVPAQFFVYLTITTKNPEFVAAFSDLVKDSEIRLTILDTNTVTTETQTYTYTEHEKGTEISQIQSQGQTIEIVKDINEEENKKEVTTTTVNTTVSTLKVTYVKTWSTEQSITYKKKSTGPIDDEPDMRDASNDPNLEDEPEPSDPPKGSTVTWKTDQKVNVERTTSGYTYEEDNRGEVKDKTGERGSQGLNADGEVDENTTFLGLLDDKFKIPNTSDEEAAGHNNFIKNADWLFYLLEKEDSLQTLEQLMKFIYYKYTEDDRYGVTTFDFNLFGISEFTSISGIYGSSVEDKFWYALKGMGYSEEAIAGAMGNIYCESSFRPTALNSSSGAYGLAQWLGGRRTNLQNYAASKGKTEEDENCQIEFLIAELTGTGDAASYATRRTVGGKGENYHTYNDWANAKDEKESAIAYCWFFETPSTADTKTDSILAIEKKRSEQATRYYKLYQNKGTGGATETSNEKSVKCYYTASNGKRFTILDQTKISGWGDKCNRAACAIIASGYSNETATQLINTRNSYSSQYYGAISGSNYWNKYGLQVTKIDKDLNIENYQDELRNQLVSGGYAMIWLNNNSSTYYGKSGTKWTSLYHWVAIIDHRYSNGKEQMAVADWRGITWVGLDEFTTHGIKHMIFVNEK